MAIFFLVYMMYFSSYLCRKHIPLVFPEPMGAGVNMGFSPEDVADIFVTLVTLYFISYAIGKFSGGFISDRSNVRILLPINVFASSLFSAGTPIAYSLYKIGILASMNSVKLIIYVTWTITGLIQGLIHPMCLKVLVDWFHGKKLAYICSWYSTSHEIGCICSLWLSGLLVEKIGWQSTFIVPALFGTLVSVVGIFILKNKPENLESSNSDTNNKSNKNPEENEAICEDKRSYWQAVKEDIIKNRTFWVLCSTLVCVYALSAGITNFFPKMLMESANQTPSAASIPIIILTVCAPIGTLSIPIISEKVFKGKRIPTIFFYMVRATIGVIVLRLITEYNGSAIISISGAVRTILTYTTMGLCGISIFGPQEFIGGIVALECGSKKVAATISSMINSLGCIGAILVTQLSRLTKTHGNQFLNDVWIIFSIIGVLLTVIIWNTKASKYYAQK